MKFELKIELVNDMMQSGTDLAKALRAVANVLEPRTAAGLKGCASKIWDINGNPVGAWKIKGG